MDTFSGVNIKTLIKEFEKTLLKTKQKQVQIGIASRILSEPNINEKNVTLTMIENLPELSESGFPLLELQESKKVVGIAPDALFFLNAVKKPFKYDTKNFEFYCAEMALKLNNLSNAESSTLRILFLNRFSLLVSAGNRMKPSIKHSLSVATDTIDIGNEFFKTASAFLNDLKILQESEN